MPARRSSTRRPGSTPRSGERGTHPQFRDFSSPDANSPALPEIPTKHSFAYGSSAVPLLPREVAAKPKMNLTEMAQNIDVGIQAAQDRERESSKELDDVNDEPVAVTRARRRPGSASLSPTRRRPKREPTRDQAQLLGTLREESPGVSQPGRSTPTPPPPVPHTLSTTSSPAQYRPLQRLQPSSHLYPSPGPFGSNRPNQSQLGISPHADSVDNDSTVSWNVERDIYDDGLQQLTPGRHLKTPRGKNISAPPRRFSGLAFSQEPVEEEPVTGSDSEIGQPPEPQIQDAPKPKPATAPTRTIIANSPRPETSFHRNISLSPQLSRTEAWGKHELSFSLRRLPAVRPVVAVILVTLSVLAMYSFSGTLSDFSHGLGAWIPSGRPYPYLPLNATGMDAVYALNNQVGKLSAQVSSLSREMKFIRSEVDKTSSSGVEIRPFIRKEAPKTNFLSIGLGAIIDPYITSPIAGSERTWSQKAYEYTAKYLWREHIREPQSPLAALSPWEDVGDCWCSTPRNGMSQLSVLLGREIVPEEVVVEHIPKAAAIDWSVAPREMELWARFKISDAAAPPRPPSRFGSLMKQLPWSSGGSRPSDMGSLFPGGSSLSQYILEAVRMAYENESESEYSDDKFLGPDFYRVGKWVYDPHGEDHIQAYTLDAVIDSPAVRVDRVVFRVKSNWGGRDTCLYRVKLHGHV